MRISDWSSDVCSSDLTVDLEDAGANKAMTFCVDAGTLQSIATKLPAEGVATIESDGNTGISIKCGRARFKLPTLSPDEFPTIATGDWDAQWEQDGTDRKSTRLNSSH